MIDQIMTLVGLASLPLIPAIIEAKALPHVADWIPNQPMQAMARMILMIYLDPFVPSAPEAMTATGSPVSHACIPIMIMYAQISP